MNPKNEVNGSLGSAERMLQTGLNGIKEAWEEGEVMYNPREYNDLQTKLARIRALTRAIEKEAKQFEPSAASRTPAIV